MSKLKVYVKCSLYCILVIYQQVCNNKGNKQVLSDITQSNLNICEEVAKDLLLNCEVDNMHYTDHAELMQDFCYQADTTSDTDQVNIIQDSCHDNADVAETTHDTDQVDITSDDDQVSLIQDSSCDNADVAEVTHDTDQVDTRSDDDQVSIIQDSCYDSADVAEGTHDTDQVDTTSDDDQVNILQDSCCDSADVGKATYDTDQADMTDDTDRSESLHDTDNVSNDSVSCSDTSDDEQSINEGLATNSETQSLYSGSSITNKDFTVALFSLSHKHSLTNSCVVDILNLVSQTLPTNLPNHSSKSYHVLRKEFLDYSGSIAVHRCCGYCSRLIPSNSICEITECQMANVAVNFYTSWY